MENNSLLPASCGAYGDDAGGYAMLSATSCRSQNRPAAPLISSSGSGVIGMSPSCTFLPPDVHFKE